MNRHSLKIPLPSLKRLPGYVHFLRSLNCEGASMVSTTDIGRALRLDPTQVRKDLAFAGAEGRPRVGYHVAELIDVLELFLGWRNSSDAFLVGTGHLGSALLGYHGLREHGLNLVAAFDSSPSKVGQEVHGVTVLDVARLPGLASRMRVHIGVLTVPSDAAQETAEKMVEGGIVSIWNFAPISLRLPDEIFVQSGELYGQLAVLLRQTEEVVARNNFQHAYGRMKGDT